MVVRLQPRSITVDRGSRGFGLSLIYRGLDKYEEKDTGIFVARVVPGGEISRTRFFYESKQVKDFELGDVIKDTCGLSTFQKSNTRNLVHCQ